MLLTKLYCGPQPCFFLLWHLWKGLESLQNFREPGWFPYLFSLLFFWHLPLLVFLSFSPEVELLIAQWCPILCDPVGCSPPGSSVHGILQERILEWIARGSSQPRARTGVSCIVGRFFFFFHNLKWIVHLFYGSAMWRVKWFSVDCSVNKTGYVIWIKILGHSKCLHF